MNILAFTSRFPLFFSFIILILILGHNMRKADRKNRKSKDEFMAREILANSTRRKPLDTVDYILIPYDSFPIEVEKDDEIISECIKDIGYLRDVPIANFTGLTNTDLKLEYGAPNITHLTKCDNDYTVLARTIQNWAERLHELGHDDDALTLLEFIIKTRTDVSSSYYLAAKIYSEKEDYAKIAWLKRTAETLNSMMAGPIQNKLNEKYPDISAY
ncbi:MAG: hypothetical protein KBS96_07045 [Lachnospiraceae bacterium]|nr:hypothetical protein [Candidatus Colinaster scatohippi]